MIKTVGRYLIVLTVACMLAFGAYWLVQNNAAALGISEMPGERGDCSFRQGSPTDSALQELPFGTTLPEGRFEGSGRDGGEHGQGVLHGMLGIARKLAIISAMTLVVIAVRSALRLIFRRKGLQPTEILL